MCSCLKYKFIVNYFNEFTADNPKYSVNLDTDVPYLVRTSRVPSSRSYSTAVAADMPHTPASGHVGNAGEVITRTVSGKSGSKYSK